jgi:hypothetical protein
LKLLRKEGVVGSEDCQTLNDLSAPLNRSRLVP